jgi:hypothetical protein
MRVPRDRVLRRCCGEKLVHFAERANLRACRVYGEDEDEDDNVEDGSMRAAWQCQRVFDREKMITH